MYNDFFVDCLVIMKSVKFFFKSKRLSSYGVHERRYSLKTAFLTVSSCKRFYRYGILDFLFCCTSLESKFVV